MKIFQKKGDLPNWAPKSFGSVLIFKLSCSNTIIPTAYAISTWTIFPIQPSPPYRMIWMETYIANQQKFEKANPEEIQDQFTQRQTIEGSEPGRQ